MESHPAQALWEHFVLATRQAQTCSTEANSQTPTGFGLYLSHKEHSDCLFENVFSSSTHKNFSSFGFVFYSLPEKKVISVVRCPSVLGLAKHRAHMHSFSHLNFCAGATLRDQQQDAAHTKCAGASEHQLLANRGRGGCQHQHLWAILAPACTPSPDPPRLEPRDSWRTTTIATHQPLLSSLRYVVCVLWLSAVRGFGM